MYLGNNYTTNKEKQTQGGKTKMHSELIKEFHKLAKTPKGYNSKDMLSIYTQVVSQANSIYAQDRELQLKVICLDNYITNLILTKYNKIVNKLEHGRSCDPTEQQFFNLVTEYKLLRISYSGMVAHLANMNNLTLTYTGSYDRFKKL